MKKIFIFCVIFCLSIFMVSSALIIGTPFEFNTEFFAEGSLVQINETHYISSYAGEDYDGFATILNINGETITNVTITEFDEIMGRYNSLVKINDTHYLNAYSGDGQSWCGI